MSISPRRRRVRAAKRRWSPRVRRRYWLLMGTGLVLIVGVVLWQLNATLWMDHSNRVGSGLVAKERQAQARALHSGNCATTSSSSSSSVVGLLEAPQIALTAPVQQGTSDAVLNVSVGHNAASVWPGTNGTAVFNAHDVSYFLNIDHLKPGDRVIYETACTEYEFAVQSHAVVAAGSPVYNTPGPSITLITCWPTDALWFTPDRYVVTAVEVAKHSLTTPPTATATLTSEDNPPAVNAPAALANQGLSLTTNYAPMGTMTLAGDPSKSFTQSPGPLNMEAAALEAYFGAIKALSQHQLSWWHDLAPGIRPPDELEGASVGKYATALDVTVDAHGDVPTGVQFNTHFAVSGGSAPGAYQVAVGFTIERGHLAISSWKMTPS